MAMDVNIPDSVPATPSDLSASSYANAYEGVPFATYGDMSIDLSRVTIGQGLRASNDAQPTTPSVQAPLDVPFYSSSHGSLVRSHIANSHPMPGVERIHHSNSHATQVRNPRYDAQSWSTMDGEPPSPSDTNRGVGYVHQPYTPSHDSAHNLFTPHHGNGGVTPLYTSSEHGSSSLSRQDQSIEKIMQPYTVPWGQANQIRGPNPASTIATQMHSPKDTKLLGHTIMNHSRDNAIQQLTAHYNSQLSTPNVNSSLNVTQTKPGMLETHQSITDDRSTTNNESESTFRSGHEMQQSNPCPTQPQSLSRTPSRMMKDRGPLSTTHGDENALHKIADSTGDVTIRVPQNSVVYVGTGQIFHNLIATQDLSTSALLRKSSTDSTLTTQALLPTRERPSETSQYFLNTLAQYLFDDDMLHCGSLAPAGSDIKSRATLSLRNLALAVRTKIIAARWFGPKHPISYRNWNKETGLLWRVARGEWILENDSFDLWQPFQEWILQIQPQYTRGAGGKDELIGENLTRSSAGRTFHEFSEKVKDDCIDELIKLLMEGWGANGWKYRDLKQAIARIEEKVLEDSRHRNILLEGMHLIWRDHMALRRSYKFSQKAW